MMEESDVKSVGMSDGFWYSRAQIEKSGGCFGD